MTRVANVLRMPHSGRLLAGGVLAGLPHGMAATSLVLIARNSSGWGAGGVLVAAYCGGVTIGQPLLGRAVDHAGPTLPLLGGATVAAATITVVGTTSAPLAVAAAAAAGAAAPPAEAILRRLWPEILPPAAVRLAYGMQTAAEQAVYIAGPLLAAGIATLFSPAAALSTAGVLGLTGALLIASAPAARTWCPTGAPLRRTGPGALRPIGLRWLLIGLLGIGATIGALAVAAAETADRLDAVWLTGALCAALSAGAMGGAVVHARWSPDGTHRRHLTAAAVAYATAWWPLVLFARPGTPAGDLAGVAVAGTAYGVLITAAYLAVTALASESTGTQAAAYVTAAFNLGTAAGAAGAAAVGGWLIAAAAATAAVPPLLAVRPRLGGDS